MNNLKQVLTLQNNHLIKVCIILYINMLNQMNAKGKGSLTTRNDKGKIDVSSEGPSSGVSSGGVGENHTLNVNLNVINAHLSLSYTLPIDSPLILFFFIPFCPVSRWLVFYYPIQFTLLCLHFVLMKSI